jgi:hypothetical protein
MYAFEPEKSAYWQQITDLPLKVDERLPTFDKYLGSYFDRNFASIIEEWELLTESDLRRIETRLAAVTNEINILYGNRTVLEKRAEALDELITSMEGKV